jgi:hypothetical protein
MASHAFYSHTTAAHLWSLPLPRALQTEAPLHVSVPRARRAPGGRLLVGHAVSVSPSDITVLRGHRVTSLERTVLDLAPLLDDEALLGAIDSALWRRRDVFERATPASLREAALRCTTRIGRARILSLVDIGTDRADSPPESAFRLRFIRAGFPEVEANSPIYDPLGNFVAMPDLQFRAHRLAFDYEGDVHRTDRRQWRKDLRRVPLLQDNDWHHTRLSGDDLADPGECLARTRRLLLDRGWRP